MSDTPRRLAPDERVPSTTSLLPDTTHTKTHDNMILIAPKLAHVKNNHNGQSPTYLDPSQPATQTPLESIPITRLQEALDAGHTTFNTLLDTLPNSWAGINSKGTLITKHTLT